jgi:site-specific recombinase XerD
MITLTYPQIDLINSYTLQNFPAHLPELKACVELMYLTGCRAQEATTKSLWSASTPTLYRLAAQKKSNERIFEAAQLPDSWKTVFNDGDRMNNYCNYRKLQYTLNNLIGHFFVKTGNKETLAHLFRHGYIKYLQYANIDEETIRQIIGHKEISSTRRYLNSVITAEHLPS